MALNKCNVRVSKFYAIIYSTNSEFENGNCEIHCFIEETRFLCSQSCGIIVGVVETKWTLVIGNERCAGEGGIAKIVAVVTHQITQRTLTFNFVNGAKSPRHQTLLA